MARALLAITHAHYDHAEWAPEFVKSAEVDHSANHLPFHGSRHDFAVPMLGNEYEKFEWKEPEYFTFQRFDPEIGEQVPVIPEIREKRFFALAPLRGSKYEFVCLHGDKLCPFSQKENQFFIPLNPDDERFMIPYDENMKSFTPLKMEESMPRAFNGEGAKRTKEFFIYGLKENKKEFMVSLEGENEFIVPYQKQELVHSYSFGPLSGLYVDCGEQRLDYQKQHEPKFLPHMHVEKVYMTVPTYFWLSMEAYYRGKYYPFYNLVAQKEIEFADFKKPFKFHDATLRAFPSSHALGAMHFTYEKNRLKAAHLVDADYREYTGIVSELESMGYPQGIASHLLDADYICLDASHMRSNYSSDNQPHKKLRRGVKAFQEWEYNYLLYSFFSTLNMFKYFEKIGMAFPTKKSREDVHFVFLNEKTYNHFRSFADPTAGEELKLDNYIEKVHKKKYSDPKRQPPKKIPNLTKYLSDEELASVDGFKHKLVDISKINKKSKRAWLKLRIPVHSVIFATHRDHKAALHLQNMFKIHTRYDYVSSRDADSVYIVPQNHPDQKEIFELLELLVDPDTENKKKGQVITLSSANPNMPKDLLKHRNFKKILMQGQSQGMRFLHASREGDVEIID